MGKSDEILGRVSHLEDGDSSREIYDAWSDCYDDHLVDEFGYVSPTVAARELGAAVDWREKAIIDFGCGTGLVGEALRQQGFETVDGIDISQGMLEQAREKRVYRNLVCADLTREIAIADGVFEAGVCIGSMGAGHVGAEHVPGLLRPVRPGGLFIVIMNAKYFDQGGFGLAFRKVESDGLWQIRKLEEFNYMTQLERPGWLLVAEKR